MENQIQHEQPDQEVAMTSGDDKLRVDLATAKRGGARKVLAQILVGTGKRMLTSPLALTDEVNIKVDRHTRMRIDLVTTSVPGKELIAQELIRIGKELLKERSSSFSRKITVKVSGATYVITEIVVQNGRKMVLERVLN